MEACVKITKRLLSGSIKNNVLTQREFEFITEQAVHMVNRRPVAFRDSLRDCQSDVLPEPITPELLIHGYNLLSLNVMPCIQYVGDDHFDPGLSFDGLNAIKDTYAKLRKVRTNLIKIYNGEFVVQLMGQATNEKSRYKPVTHDRLEVGDVVLLKELHCKPTNYPMGLVKEVQTNDLGETTCASVLKGATGEIVKRHASVLIPLLKLREQNNDTLSSAEGRGSTSLEPVAAFPGVEFDEQLLWRVS